MKKIVYYICFLPLAVVAQQPQRASLNLNGYYNNERIRSEEIISEEEHKNDPLFRHTSYDLFIPYDSIMAQPVFFFSNNIMFKSRVVNRINGYINANLRKEFIYEKSKGEEWGFYKIENDIITAFVYCKFLNNGFPRVVVKPVKYTGVIKNDSTIIHWRAVPPYPEVSRGDEQIETIESTLTFKSMPDRSFIDTSKAWINVIKNKTGF